MGEEVETVLSESFIYGKERVWRKLFVSDRRNDSMFGGKGASLVAQLVNNPPAKQQTLVQFLGWEDPLEEGMTTHSSILTWRIPIDRGAWQATVHGVTKNWTRLRD